MREIGAPAIGGGTACGGSGAARIIRRFGRCVPLDARPGAVPGVVLVDVTPFVQ